MEEHPPRTPPRLWARTGKRHRAEIYVKKPISRVSVFTGLSPPTAHHRDAGHYRTTSSRRTSSLAVCRVFWYASGLTGLGGPARLYQGIERIETRPFYEPPGTVLPKAASVGRAKRLRGATMYRALRGLRIQTCAVLLLACIPDKLRGARDGETARVPYRTPCSWRRYQT